MAKLQNKKGIEIVKKTLSLSAPTGDIQKSTADSTMFFRGRTDALIKRMGEIERDYEKNYPNALVTQDDEYKRILDRIKQTGLDVQRQKNKGKEGFDKFGNPVKKTMGAAADKTKKQ